MQNTKTLERLLISRRAFLGLIACSSLFSTANAKINITQPLLMSSESDELAFADQPGLGPQIDAPIVAKFFTPLHPKKDLATLPNTEQEMRYVESLLKNLFYREGMRWRESYQVNISYQHFGVAHPSYYGQQLLWYCKKVQDYLYHRLNDLNSSELSWSILTPGNNKTLPPDDGFKAIVGQYTYYVLHAHVSGIEYDTAPDLIQAIPVERAIHYIESDPSFRPIRGVIYIIPGSTSLVSPFSEILHLTLHRASRRYEKELAKRMAPGLARHNAINAGETVNEAAALLLATEYLQKYDHSRQRSIENMLTFLSNRLLLLPNTLAYMRKKGIQFSLNLFKENPARFMINVVNS